MAKKEKVFISGAISSALSTYQYQFSEAQMVLEHLGYIVLNPAWLPLGMEYADYIAIDDAMLLQSDIICLLPGWAKSVGARREKKIAERNGIRVMFYKNIRCW